VASDRCLLGFAHRFYSVLCVLMNSSVCRLVHPTSSSSFLSTYASYVCNQHHHISYLGSFRTYPFLAATMLVRLPLSRSRANHERDRSNLVQGAAKHHNGRRRAIDPWPSPNMEGLRLVRFPGCGDASARFHTSTSPGKPWLPARSRYL